MDVAFFMRKSSRHFNKMRITGKDVTQVSNKINEHIKEGRYNFNQLVNIHYDMSILGRHVDTVLNSILHKLRNDSKV